MTTVSKAIADEIVKRNGYYKNDRRVLVIYKYKTMWATTAYKLWYNKEGIKAENTIMYDIKIYWKADEQSSNGSSTTVS
jgi:hypothetical protein